MAVRILQGDCREVLAYAAGVIDSDGTIGIRRLTYSMRVVGDSAQPAYAVRIKVKQVSPEAVLLLQAVFGGSLRQDKPSTSRGKPLHAWEIKDRLAGDCLVALLPYLRIKKAQAENCLALRNAIERSKKQRLAIGRGHVGSARRDPAMSAEMERLFLRAKELNVVGVQP